LLLSEIAISLFLMVVTSISELGRVAARNPGIRYVDGEVLENLARPERPGEPASRVEPVVIREKRERASGIGVCRIEYFAAFFWLAMRSDSLAGRIAGWQMCGLPQFRKLLKVIEIG
jgi:hypothetical protein